VGKFILVSTYSIETGRGGGAETPARIWGRRCGGSSDSSKYRFCGLWTRDAPGWE